MLVTVKCKPALKKHSEMTSATAYAGAINNMKKKVKS